MPPLEPPTLFGFSPLQPSGLASSPVNIYNPTECDFKQPNFDEKDRRGYDDTGSKPEYDSDSKEEEIIEINISTIPRRQLRGPSLHTSNIYMYIYTPHRSGLIIHGSLFMVTSHTDNLAPSSAAFYPDVYHCLNFKVPTLSIFFFFFFFSTSFFFNIYI